MNIFNTQIKGSTIEDFSKANVSLISKSIWESVSDVTVDVTLRNVSLLLLRALADALEVIFAWAMAAMLFLQIAGMIYDQWDPCDLQTELSVDALSQLTNSYNIEFRQQVLSQISTVTNSTGQKIYSFNWPVLWYADSILLDLSSEKKGSPKREDGKTDYQYWDRRKLIHTYNYQSSLTVNSIGQPICWSPDLTMFTNECRLINNNDLKQLEKSISMMLSDNNTVVANFLFKYWKVILLCNIININFYSYY